MMRHDSVIVAGAGPVGLVAALVLADAGVKVTVLEKRAALNTASKASTFHPPTLEILAHLGVLPLVLDLGVIADRVQFRTAAEGVFAAFSLSLLKGDTPYPFRMHLEQAQVTPLLLRRIRRHRHAEIWFNAEIVALSTEGEGVRARIRRDGLDSDLTGQYLIGADGSRSRVRDALGASFDGIVYPDKILRVMTDEDLGGLVPGLAPVTYLFNGDKSISFLKMPDCWRIILRVAKEHSDEQALAPDWILDRLREVIPHCRRLPNVAMKDVYQVSRRVAGFYRAGSAYLAGDAAHLTNTRGGMNMNCGIHDAFAIATAMVEAVRRGDRSIVDAASDRRRRVATEQLIPRTDRNVAGGQAWLDKLRDMAASREQALDYLRATAMMDMAPPIPAVA